MSGDGVTTLESLMCFLADHISDKLGIVDFACFLVDEDEASGAGLTRVFLKRESEVLDVGGKHCDADAFFWGVDCDGTDGETGERGDVAGATALGFDDEDAAAGGGCGLLDCVAVANEFVETGVGANAVFGSGDVV